MICQEIRGVLLDDHASNLLEDHTSIIRIKSNLDNVSDKFDFKRVYEKEVIQEVMNLNSKKATCHGASYSSQNS